ncbi:MAG: ComEC/Rec2 family competence protein [Pseudomonadota bacterium]
MYASDLSETSLGETRLPGDAGETRVGWRGVALRLASDALLRQRGTLLHWVPICIALGIGLWFALPREPTAPIYLALGGGVLAMLGLSRRVGEAAAPLLVAAALVAAGAVIAGGRAHWVAAPVLEFRYYGPIEGRVVWIDRAASGAPRITLDRVRLRDVAPARTPARVRLSLFEVDLGIRPEPGMTAMLTGHLSPPGGPVEPGGFNFARKAWFERLGAVGYSRTPVLLAAPIEGGAALALFRTRMALSASIQEALPGARGAVATAILTGDRSAIPPDALENLRGANLAHLLAISGLHMGLLTGVVFAAFRGGLALVPYTALRLPGKKIAAIAAVLAGAVYLALSGGNVATIRAFIMVTVVFAAVLLDRRAISLRSVALAATLVLLLMPEALSGPGFQMSFAATVALVAAFGAVRDWTGPQLPRWLWPVGAVILSSLVAGLATAPYAAAHFNRFTDYGLIANLLSVPLMGAVIMPAGVAAALLAPLGLGWIGLEIMGWGLAWVLGVAAWITALDGAVTPVAAPGPWVLPLMSIGALFALLWQGLLRWIGMVPLALAAALWIGAERPVLLVSESGGLIGVLGPEGRALSKGRGDGFSARIWLENDGDVAGQEDAALRPGFTGESGNRFVVVQDTRIAHITGRGREERAAAACSHADIVIVNTELETPALGSCAIIDAASLALSGALAFTTRPNGTLDSAGARTPSVGRLWHAR